MRAERDLEQHYLVIKSYLEFDEQSDVTGGGMSLYILRHRLGNRKTCS